MKGSPSADGYWIIAGSCLCSMRMGRNACGPGQVMVHYMIDEGLASHCVLISEK